MWPPGVTVVLLLAGASVSPSWYTHTLHTSDTAGTLGGALGSPARVDHRLRRWVPELDTGRLGQGRATTDTGLSHPPAPRSEHAAAPCTRPAPRTLASRAVSCCCQYAAQQATSHSAPSWENHFAHYTDTGCLKIVLRIIQIQGVSKNVISWNNGNKNELRKNRSLDSWQMWHVRINNASSLFFSILSAKEIHYTW